MLFCNIVAEGMLIKSCLFQQRQNALVQRGEVRPLHLERGHGLELDALYFIEVLRMKGQHEQQGVAPDELKQGGLAKIAGLGADNEEAARYAAHIDDR